MSGSREKTQETLAGTLGVHKHSRQLVTLTFQVVLLHLSHLTK